MDILPYLDTQKKYTEKQLTFLERYGKTFNVTEACNAAGYSVSLVPASLVNEVDILNKSYFSKHTIEAVDTVVGVLHGDIEGREANTRLEAAKTVMDRTGLIKSEKKDVSVQGEATGIFVLPPKDSGV
jgi:hypothetical protein